MLLKKDKVEVEDLKEEENPELTSLITIKPPKKEPLLPSKEPKKLCELIIINTNK